MKSAAMSFTLSFTPLVAIKNEAMKEFNRALRKDPNHIEALAGKAEFLETYDPPRSLNDALKIYKTILELHEGSESPDSQRHATFAADRIRYCEARKLSYQSRKFVKQGQPAALKQACKYLKEAYELYPNDRRNAMNYGYALFQVEDFENACKVCEAALRIDPKYARARLILGTAQARIGLLARARESLRQCLESAPSGSDYDDAHSSLKAVEHDLASIRNQLYDTLAGGLDDMPGLDKLKSWMVALTGEPISEADLGRRKDASYELMAIGPRQRFLASPGPEGLRIEILLPPRS
jgi:tetratricopeptide (TPR) repeat protein